MPKKYFTYVVTNTIGFVLGATFMLILGLVAISLENSNVEFEESKQDFEIRYTNYTDYQRQIILHHVDNALVGLSDNASEFDKAAAINSYLFQYFERVDVYGTGGVDFLNRGQSFCGGTVVSMAEMLYALNIESKYAYVYGGVIAHSMVEVIFSDESRGLFDPYNGFVFYNDQTLQPISIYAISNQEVQVMDILYLTRDGKVDNKSDIQPYYSFGDSYVKATEDLIATRDFDIVGLFEHMNGAGVANEGRGDYVQIDIQPGDLFGLREWKPSDSITPWTELSLWQRDDDMYMSWAYMAGNTSLGYDVKHSYHITGLTPGQTYNLRLYLSHGYLEGGNNRDFLTMTFQQLSPFSPAYIRQVTPFSSPLNENFEPLQIEYSFQSDNGNTLITYEVNGGEVIIMGIEIVD